MKAFRNKQVIDNIEETIDRTIFDMKLNEDEEENLASIYSLGYDYIEENYAELFADSFGNDIALLMCEELYERIADELKDRGGKNENMDY